MNRKPNPSINTDWRDKAAPAGYVKRLKDEQIKAIGIALTVLYCGNSATPLWWWRKQ